MIAALLALSIFFPALPGRLVNAKADILISLFKVALLKPSVPAFRRANQSTSLYEEAAHNVTKRGRLQASDVETTEAFYRANCTTSIRMFNLPAIRVYIQVKILQ